MNERIAAFNSKEFNFDLSRALKEHDGIGPVRALTELTLVVDPQVFLKFLVMLTKENCNTMSLDESSHKIKGKYIENNNTIEFVIELLKIDE